MTWHDKIYARLHEYWNKHSIEPNYAFMHEDVARAYANESGKEYGEFPSFELIMPKIASFVPAGYIVVGRCEAYKE